MTDAERMEEEVFKVVCGHCGWRGDSVARLSVPDPLLPGLKLHGCPDCKVLQSTLSGACDEPGCWKPHTCGTPTWVGWRWTCGEHRPETEG